LPVSDKEFSNPDREMKIKYNMDHFNDNLFSRNYRWKLSFGTNTCAACTKQLRESRKTSQ